MKKGRPPKKMKRPRQSAARQNAGPLALFGFVVNVTASFFRQFSRHISTWEKELNRRRQTLKPLENQGFFRLSLLYRNGIFIYLWFHKQHNCFLSKLIISSFSRHQYSMFFCIILKYRNLIFD